MFLQRELKKINLLLYLFVFCSTLLIRNLLFSSCEKLTTGENAACPRTITPNGDGTNDIVFFLFPNPSDTAMKGTIYDLRSAKVGEAKSRTIANNETVLSWDGKDESGSVVTSGIYLYRIEIGNKVITGTVVVTR